MLTVTNILQNFTANQTDIIGLVHLYRDASNYEAYATEAIYLDSKFYRGIISDLGSWSEKWNIETDNTVTQSTPSISIRNEVYPDGSGSVVGTLFGDTYVGNRATVLLGYRGFALSDYITIYDGRIDDIEVSGEDLVLNLKKAELPSTHIGGRKINGKLIGEDDYSANFTIPPESQDRYLPVPFGYQWNSPVVLYRSGVGDTTSWAYVDFSWYAAGMVTSTTTGIRPLGAKRDNLWQSGTYDDQLVLYVANEGKLVPIYQLAHTGYTTYTLGVDTGASSTIGRFIIEGPEGDSETLQYNREIIANVPLRLYRLSGTGHAADYNNISLTAGGGAGAPVDDSGIDSLLDDDINTYLGTFYNATDGTWAEIVFNAIVDLPKQLRSDLNFCVNSLLPIHIPQPMDTSGGDQYTVLVFGKFTFDPAGAQTEFRNQNHLFAFTVGNDRLTYDLPDPTTASTNGATGWMDTWNAGTDNEHYIGATFWGRGSLYSFGRDWYPPTSNVYENGGQDDGYHYWTHTRQNYGGALITLVNVPDANRYSFADDAVSLDQVATVGNLLDESPQYSAFELVKPAMMELPYLRREALDGGVGFRVEIRWDTHVDSGTTEVAGTFYSLYLEAIETIPFDWEDDKYTMLKGYQDEDWDTGTPNELVTFDAAFADEAYQYLEAIIRRKLGAAAADLNSEWADIPLIYTDFFATDRTGSGFVFSTEEDTPFDEFIEEYCKYEPFTVYRDQLGKYRYLQVPIDQATLTRDYYAGSGGTNRRDTIDYNRCDLGFSIRLSDKKYLCSEVKHMYSDFVFHDESFVQDQHWKIDGAVYDYTYWDADNSETTNKHFLESIEKRYTSSPTPSRVANASDSTKGYCCKLTNEGTLIPLVRSAEGDVKYWEPLAGTSSDWGSLTSYTASGQAGHWVGWDAENKAIASYWINMWCNRKRIITFSSTYMKFIKHEIGDVLRFSNVPYTCLGLTMLGFNGDTTTTFVEVNGQDMYCDFIITRITKSVGRVEIECMQLCELDAFITERQSRSPRPRYDRDTPISALGKLGRKLSKQQAFKR